MAAAQQRDHTLSAAASFQEKCYVESSMWKNGCFERGLYILHHRFISQGRYTDALI